MAFQRDISRIFTRLADLVWPPQSLLSDAPVSAVGVIEPALWQAIDFLCGPVCACCGRPLPEALHDDTECPVCLAQRPPFDTARAAFAYDDITRGLVLAMKRGNRADGVRAFAGWMAQVCPHLALADFIIPVPLHWWRLAQRGYNQSAWLAAALARHTKRPWHPGILARAKATPSQAGLSGSGRVRNMQGAFVVTRAFKARLKGAKLVLVDDVFTTGATVAACTRVLKRAGAARVDVVCLARVVKPSRVDI